MHDIILVHKNSPYLITAYLQVKKAFALANCDLGVINPQASQAIVQSSDTVLSEEKDGKHILASLELMSDSAINTKINDAILEHTQERLENNQLNSNQETAQVFALATRLAILLALTDLEPVILNLERLLRRDALAIAKVLKTTASPHMQATTGEWGKKLNVFAIAMQSALKRVKEAANDLLDHENFNHEMENYEHLSMDPSGIDPVIIDKTMLNHLANISGFKFKGQDDAWQSTFAASDLLRISSSLKDLATVLSKIALVANVVNSAAPANGGTGNNPAKTYADNLNMAAHNLIGNNVSLTFLSQCEQLQGALLMPLLSHNLLTAIDLLQRAVIEFEQKGFQDTTN